MEYGLTTWLMAGLAGVLVGIAKNGVPGLGILVVPLMAYVFPARESVGVLLPMLIVGDVMAIALYRRHAQWRALIGLLPYVVIGMLAAAWVLARLDNTSLRPVLGWLILGLLVMEVARNRMRWTRLPHHPVFGGGIGIASGFATTLGNAAGPIMSLYLLSRNLVKSQFVGTAAWFFFVVNSSKVPLYVHLDIITERTLLFNLLVAPFVLVGAFIGYRLLPHISPTLFKNLVLSLTALAALGLLV